MPIAEPAISEAVSSVDERHLEALTDPAVARAKFERELAEYRRLEHEYLRRGWLLVRAEFPEVMVVFAAPQLQPRVVLFGVIVDFSDYDFRPLSVRFVDPFTQQPLRLEQVPVPIGQRRRVRAAPAEAGAERAATPPVEAMGFELQNLLQAMQDGRPFLCIAGVREYHEHPYHSNDPWLAHRGTGVGRLHHILDVIYRHGVAPLRGVRYQTQIQVQVAGFMANPDEVPEGPPVERL